MLVRDECLIDTGGGIALSKREDFENSDRGFV